MNMRLVTLLSVILCPAVWPLAPVANAGAPVVLDPNWQLELVDQEPNLVTPTGCCFDPQGRLFVIECNTHFAPEDYERASHDRIYLYEDTTGDGKLDSRTVYYDDGIATMNITYIGDGWLAVVTREHVKRIRDNDGNKIADEIEVLLELKTEATYPHNGLGGLAYGDDGWLYVGQGENFGAEYSLVAADGSSQVGSGEGGNVFRLRPDGKNLQRIATGFWNPFGICMDSAGRVWTVGNDPDAMPPCRLLHVVEGADYGFQFRFGRAGIHPLQAWNGELPGTLPMAAGTGEATCGVIQHNNALWVTSWGDNRIERYTLTPSGATLTGHMEIVVQGDANFRPVGIAVAKDGSIYFTDWVDRSYPVHGSGKLWRLAPIERKRLASGSYPQMSAEERLADRLRVDLGMGIEERLASLGSSDPFVRQAATVGMVNTGQLRQLSWDSLTTNDQRLGYLLAWHWQELIDANQLNAKQRTEIIDAGIDSFSDSVIISAVRWAAERSAKEHLPSMRNILKRENLSARLFDAVIASIAYLETGSASGGRRDPAMESLLVSFVRDTSNSVRLRSLAVRKLPASVETLKAKELRDFLSQTPDRTFGIEIVRFLSAKGDAEAEAVLAEIAADESLDVQTRADALASLSGNAATHARLINKLALPRQPEVLRNEAKRIIDYAANLSGSSIPKPDDLAAWENLVASGGNVDSGRRVFSRRTCIHCHSHSGRGANTGPDLTTFAATTTVQRLLESILLPNKEIGPLYVPYRVLTVDGKILTGLKLDGSGAGESMRFQGADGEQFSVAMKAIDLMEPVQQSIMPSGLQESMTIEEFRDLVAFLRSSESETNKD